MANILLAAGGPSHPRWADVPPLSDENVRALRWGLRALGRARERHQGADDAVDYWTAAVEAVWWVSALDEGCTRWLGSRYETARVADPDGRVADAFYWLRNRHSHEVAISGQGGPLVPFFAPDGGFDISPVTVWLPIDQIRAETEPKGRVARQRRAAYEQHLAGRPIAGTLSTAGRWFYRVFEMAGLPPVPVADDPTIL